MTAEEVYSARLGGIKNWMHCPPTQIPEEFLPSSMKRWDWRPLEVSGRDTFNLLCLEPASKARRHFREWQQRIGHQLYCTGILFLSGQ